MLTIGAVAPDFELPDQHGRLVRLADLLAAGPVVLFFYPAALSPGCTAQSCHFRDLAAEFAALGATRVGVSRDEVAKQQKFDNTHDLGYQLLSDRDGVVASAYGVRRRGGHLLPAKRVTFVVEPDGRVIEVVHSEVHMAAHADRAIQALRDRAAGSDKAADTQVS